ncbi:MAG: hypothetical protein OEV15_08725, partial [Gallionella sp.]|nr:hypothetical protein [Gallionella sp.]
MELRRSLTLFFLALTMMMVGCAETHKVMSFNNYSQGTEPKVFPAPPDEPRYRYAGELIGEENFQPDSMVNRSSATRFFEWLVGISGYGDDPIVLQRPQSGMVDAEGRIYVTDISRGAVYVFDKLAGQLDVWERSGKNERFVAPIGIAQGLQGEILVADAELHSVFRLNSSGEPVGEFGRDVLMRPTGLAFDVKRGLVYVADTHG